MRQRSLGSGFIIDKDGYIITNNHVVEGAQEIKVKLTDGREFSAKVMGKDPKTDLALIKISSLFKDLPVLALGDSDKIRVGDWVIAVGNPFGLEHTVTQGIISATGRVIGSGPYDNFLQTDAPINPGNSGGPLINVMGEVVGVNSAIIAGGQGIGFAIPSNMAKSVSAQLKEKGKVTRGWIGVSIQSVSPEIAKAFGLKEEKGALVAGVVAGSPAEAAGIKRGDIIVSFDGKEIKNSTDLPVRVAEAQLGRTVTVKVLREGKETDLSVKVSEMPEGKFAALTGSRESSLGVTVKDITPELRRQLGIREKSGVIVIDVASGSPAEDAGLRAGDVIKEVNRKPVKSVKDYETLIAKAREDEPLLLLIQRGNQAIFVAIPM
jgi:serine protease Do